MPSISALRKAPEVSERERNVIFLKTRIKKLHWMGLDAEAELLLIQLHDLDPTATQLFSPVDTD